MKLKIHSKGTPGSTRVMDAETGEELANVMGVSWNCTGGSETATAVITVERVPVTLVADSTVVEAPQLVEGT